MSKLTNNDFDGIALSRFFSNSILSQLAQNGQSNVGHRLGKQLKLFEYFDPKTSVADFYDDIFKQLDKSYRHEYIYKNAIAEKILLGKHSLASACMLSEFGVHKCKADVVVLNGTSHVYEIKSEMDNFDRLENQLNSYKKMFDLITVITSENLFGAVSSRVDKSVGIMVMGNNDYAFLDKPYREPLENLQNVESEVIFDALKRDEYLEVIRNEFNEDLSGIPNTQVYSLAKSYFKRLSPEVAHAYMVKMLKQRKEILRISEYIDEVPGSLKAAYLSMRLTKSNNTTFIDSLKEKISIAFA